MTLQEQKKQLEKLQLQFDIAAEIAEAKIAEDKIDALIASLTEERDAMAASS